jgi:hypothetical protein
LFDESVVADIHAGANACRCHTAVYELTGLDDGVATNNGPIDI